MLDRPPRRQEPIVCKRFIDMEGTTIGELLVLYPIDTPAHVGAKNKSVYYWVKCSCGKEFATCSRTLRRRKRSDYEDFGATACKECAHTLRIKKFRTVHGQSRSRLYRIWKMMKTRCSDPKHHKYHRYGGRGISVCEDWRQDFKEFWKWSLENGYADKLTLERIDNNGNYCPENCKWVPKEEQDWNKQFTKYIEVDGEFISFARYYYKTRRQINYNTATCRLRSGWTLEEIFAVPYGKRRSSKNY